MHLDEAYKETSNTVQNLTRKNRKTNFEEKLNVNTANSKNFKKIKTTRFARSPYINICLKSKEELPFDFFTIS